MRRNHVLSIIIQNYVCMGIITLVWVVWGFSLCFGASGRFIGDPSDFAMLNRVNYKNLPHEGRGKMGEAYVEGIPGLVFACYQGMFAVITPALMTGAFAERIKFGPFLVFVVLWVHLVYFPWRGPGSPLLSPTTSSDGHESRRSRAGATGSGARTAGSGPGASATLPEV